MIIYGKSLNVVKQTSITNYIINPKYIVFSHETKEDICSESYESNDHASWQRKESTIDSDNDLYEKIHYQNRPEDREVKDREEGQHKAGTHRLHAIPPMVNNRVYPKPKGKLGNLTNKRSVLRGVACGKLCCIVIIYFLFMRYFKNNIRLVTKSPTTNSGDIRPEHT